MARGNEQTRSPMKKRCSTPRKAKQRPTTGALRASYHFIRQITEVSPVVLDVFDLVTESHSYRSSNVVNLFGYTRDEIAQMKDHFSVLSMEERVRLVKGTFSIRSQPGSGNAGHSSRSLGRERVMPGKFDRRKGPDSD
jgi:hypothetical protein